MSLKIQIITFLVSVLFDDYIPYAISLNEAKNIEKYIENNEAYRKLIYGKNYNFLKIM